MINAPTVLGMDLSLAGTGCATRDRTWVHKTKGQRGDSYLERLRRLQVVRGWCLEQLAEVRPDLLVIEGPAPNATQRVSSWDRAKLWWDVLEAADQTGVPVAIAPPSSVKKFATDNGNCRKDEMIGAAYRRMPHLENVPDANAADAAWLMAIGFAWLGSPVASVPAAQARAINGVAFPDRSLVRAA